MDLSIGNFMATPIITAFLAVVYKFTVIPNWAKPFIAMLIGVAVGVWAMYYSVADPTFQNWSDHLLGGWTQGMAAVGLWEGVSKIKGGVHA